MIYATIFAFFITLIDQVSKLLALAYLKSPVEIFGESISLSLQTNTGIAFSIPIPQIITILLTLGIILGGSIVAYFSLPWKNKFYATAYTCILGGAIGNFIDRIAHGAVIDFIKIGWWPVFNIADIAICVGAGIMLVYTFFIEGKKTQREPKT